MIRYTVFLLILVAVFGLLIGDSTFVYAIEGSLLCFAYGSMVIGRLVRGYSFKLTTYSRMGDLSIVAFFLIWVATSAINSSWGYANFIALVRYIPLAYLVGAFFSRRDIDYVCFLMLVIGVSQILVASLQLSGLLPWVLVEVPVEKQGLYGVFKDNVSFASLMLISLMIVVELLRIRWIPKIVVAVVFLCFLFLSGSRGHFMIGVAFFFLRLIGLGYKETAAVAGIAVTALYLLEVDLGGSNTDFLFFLSPEYLAVAMQQRLGLVFELLPQFIFSVNALFGLGSEKEDVVYFLISNYRFNYLNPYFLRYILEDVYWVSMIFYYGMFGLIAFLIYLWGVIRLTKAVLNRRAQHRGGIHIFVWLLMSSVPLGLIGPVLEVKVYSLVLWILAGGVLVEVRRGVEARRNAGSRRSIEFSRGKDFRGNARSKRSVETHRNV